VTAFIRHITNTLAATPAAHPRAVNRPACTRPCLWKFDSAEGSSRKSLNLLALKMWLTSLDDFRNWLMREVA
jgi:hypothetical protein